MDIAVVQKILNDAFKEFELAGNAPSDVVVTLVSADIYRRLMKKK